MKDKIIGIDFDGTCVTHEYPRVGRSVGANAVLERIVREGGKLILWTMRSGNRPDGTDPLKDAVDWFKRQGIPLWAVNGNPQQHTWTSSPKAYCHLYIDDAALGCPLVKGKNGERDYVDWKKVDRMLWPVPRKKRKSATA